MPTPTTNHGYSKPDDGQLDWDVPVNENYDQLDKEVPIVDTDANKGNYTAFDNACYIAFDTGNVYYGSSSSWVLVGQIGGSGGDADTLDGLDSTAFAVLSDNEIVSGQWDFTDALELVTDNGDGNGGVRIETTASDRFYIAPYDGAGSLVFNREITYDPAVGEWDFEGSPRAGGSTILTTGSTIDADTLAGQSESVYARVDQQETVTTSWNFGSELRVRTDNGDGNGGAILDVDANDRFYIAPYDGAGSLVFNREITYDPAVGEWNLEGAPRAGGSTILTAGSESEDVDFTGDLEHDGEDVMSVKSSPNLHLPLTSLEAAGGNDVATQSLWVPAGETFSLWGWGILDNTGGLPTNVDLYVRSGDLTGSPTTEFSDTSANQWSEGASGTALTTVDGGTTGIAVHIQMENQDASAADVSLRAGYTIE